MRERACASGYMHVSVHGRVHVHVCMRMYAQMHNALACDHACCAHGISRVHAHIYGKEKREKV